MIALSRSITGKSSVDFAEVMIGRTIHPYPTVAEAIQGCGIGYNRTQWATMENNGRKKLEKLLGAVKPYVIGVLGGLALAALARRR